MKENSRIQVLGWLIYDWSVFFSGCAVGLIEPSGGNNLDELQNGNFRVILQFMLHLIFEY